MPLAGFAAREIVATSGEIVVPELLLSFLYIAIGILRINAYIVVILINIPASAATSVPGTFASADTALYDAARP